MDTASQTLWLRLTVALSLMWIVPGVSIQAIIALDAAGLKPPIHDDLFCITFLGTSQIIAVCFMLWWRFVSWTFGRIAGTSCMTAAALGHLLLWRPLWDAGCMGVGFLKLGQSLSVGGLWMVLTAYLWWGLAEGVGYWRKRVMSPSAVRLIYGMGLIPFIPGAWWILAMAMNTFVFNSDRTSITITHLICGLIVVGWWLLIWRRAVAWTPAIVRRSLTLAFGYLLISTLAPLLPDSPDWVNAMRITVPLMLTGLWFVLTARWWQPAAPLAAVRASEIRGLLRCSSCGYSLIGLHESRCPECGRSMTLDELFEEMLAARENTLA